MIYILMILIRIYIIHFNVLIFTGAFTSPCFSYIFPFFSSLLRDGGARVNGDEEIMMQILECVNINVKAASQTGKHEILSGSIILAEKHGPSRTCEFIFIVGRKYM